MRTGTGDAEYNRRNPTGDRWLDVPREKVGKNSLKRKQKILRIIGDIQDVFSQRERGVSLSKCAAVTLGERVLGGR